MERCPCHRKMSYCPDAPSSADLRPRVAATHVKVLHAESNARRSPVGTSKRVMASKSRLPSGPSFIAPLPAI